MSAGGRDLASGFSLVEALVAIAVAGMVLAAAAGLTGLARDADGRFDREASARDQLMASDRILRDVMTGSVPELDVREAGASGGTSARLTVLTMGSAIMAFDRPLPVTLAVRDRKDGGKSLIVAWRDPQSGVAREEIAIDGARKISLSYFVVEIGRPSGWRSHWSHPGRLPSAVSLKVDHPILGPPIDIVARTVARYPQVCAALPHVAFCHRGAARNSDPPE